MENKEPFRDPRIEKIGERIETLIFNIRMSVEDITAPDDQGCFDFEHTEEHYELIENFESELIKLYIMLERNLTKKSYNSIEEVRKMLDEEIEWEKTCHTQDG